MYSTVDSVIVGRYVGDRALSAIGTTLPIINCFLCSLWRSLQAQESWWHSTTGQG